jgi:hypothetical protein
MDTGGPVWSKRDTAYLGATAVAATIAACVVFGNTPSTPRDFAAATIDGSALPVPMVAPAPPRRHVDVELVPVEVTRVVLGTIEHVVHVAATPPSIPAPSVRSTPPPPTVAPTALPVKRASGKKPKKVKTKPGDASGPR